MAEHVFLFTIFMVLVALLAICFFVTRAIVAVKQAKVRVAEETAYRAIAEKAVSAQADTANALAAVQTALADMQARLVSVEKILKEVE